MKIMEIKLTELPKYRYDIIINNIKSEFGVDIDKNNDIRITLYIDREKGIYADVTNKLNISKKNKDRELQQGLIDFVNSHLTYQYGGIVNIKVMYENYIEWCKSTGRQYYKSISAFNTDKFNKYISSKNMTKNKDVIYNAVYGIVRYI